MAIRIVTDSTAYLTPEYIEQHQIRVAPLKVVFDGQAYREGLDLSNDEFYRRLRTATRLPTTSQPSVGEFQAIYSELAAQGHEIISIHLSGTLSGTLESARSAAALLPTARIHVVDSMTAALAMEMMIRRVVAAAEGGRDAAYILDRLDTMTRDLRLFFVVDTLEYLEKGGRIGGARALLGTLLRIKPILTLNRGQVEVFATVRTKHKAVAALVDHLVEIARGQCVYATVGHAAAPEEMAELGRMLSERLDCADLFSAYIGPVIGTHAGPGVLGAAICPIESAP
jgi:DegV family protein with EDD domain